MISWFVGSILDVYTRLSLLVSRLVAFLGIALVEAHSLEHVGISLLYIYLLPFMIPSGDMFKNGIH